MCICLCGPIFLSVSGHGGVGRRLRWGLGLCIVTLVPSVSYESVPLLRVNELSEPQLIFTSYGEVGKVPFGLKSSSLC